MSSANSVSDSSRFDLLDSTSNMKLLSRSEILPSLMVVVALIGMGLSGYLGWAALTSSKVAGCGSGQIFNCGHVLTTKWSSVFGVPVGIMALGVYGVVLASLITNVTAKSESLIKLSRFLLLTGSLAAAGAAIWFISLQIFVVEHYCQWCLGAHACSLVLSAMALIYLKPNWSQAATSGGISMASLAVLAGVQISTEPPPTFEIQSYSNQPVTTDDPEQATPNGNASEFSAPGIGTESDSDDDGMFLPPGASQPNDHTNLWQAPKQDLIRDSLISLMQPSIALGSYLPQDPQPSAAGQQKQAEDRPVVYINGGKQKLDARHWPFIGSTDADRKFVEMFDYTCPHCRNTHTAMKGAMEKMGQDKLGVIVLCVPMNTNCNNSIQMTDPAHADACELARLAVAVWRVDSDQFAAYHDWLFEGAQAPNAANARAKAESMVGKDKLDKELASNIPDQYVQKHVQLYRQLGAGTIPKMLFSGNAVAGEIGSADSMIQIIKQQTSGK